jgi:putative membrane protein
MPRNLKENILLYLKGMGMGAADVVPGVSGGTIAFISGIYEELLASIKAVGPDTVKALKSEGVAGAWKQVNGAFLLPVLLGIGSSVILLVRPITWLLDNKPVLIWSFFFGLILASILLIAKQIRRWTGLTWLMLLVGTSISLFIGLSNSGDGNEAGWFIFLAGSLAICAMILPGISGSFILLLLGAYGTVTGAIKDFEFKTIALFGAGCITGLMAFSRLLNWMFKKYHDVTVALMTGFLAGSLYVVWPWKRILSLRLAHEGKPNEELVPFLTENVMPADFITLTELDQQLGITDKDPQVVGSIALCLFGAGVLLFLERFGPKQG